MITRKNVYWGCGVLVAGGLVAAFAEPVCDFIAGRLENTRLVKAACAELNARFARSANAGLYEAPFAVSFEGNEALEFRVRVSSKEGEPEFSGWCDVVYKPNS